MLNYNSEVAKPKNPDDFEEFCLIVYRVVFGDKTATKNGRSGQKQNGVDIFAQHGGQRIGIQCKRVKFGELTTEIIDAEVEAADKGAVPITELIVATTAPNDAKLIKHAQQLSDSRKSRGLFTVSLAFWDALESYVNQHAELQFQFAPSAPGGAFYKLSQDNQKLLDAANQLLSRVTPAVLAQGQLPEGRADSLNKVITGQLDAIRKTIMAGRFQEALDRLVTIGTSLESFDNHQRFRWHSQRAICYWRLGDKPAASKAYEHAHELAPGEDQAAANFIIASLLVERPEEALSRAESAAQRFPASAAVWSAWANAQYTGGRPVELASVPLELREVGQVLHTFAWVNLRKGNFQLAAEQSQKAYRAESASFDSKSLFLVCALSLVTKDAVRAALGAPTEAEAALLVEAIKAFVPFREKLWVVQDKQSLSEALLHLGYALQITNRAKEAHDLLEEAIELFPDVKYLNRAFLECLQRQGDPDEAYEFGLRKVDAIDESGLAMLGELAAHRGDIQTVEAIKSKLAASSKYSNLKDDVEALLWLALWKNNKVEELRSALSAANLATSLNITQLSVAARILNKLDSDKSESAKVLDRMNSLVQSEASGGDILQAAQADLVCGRYEEAAKLYRRVVPLDVFSEHYEKFLYSLIKSGKRREAFALITKAPAGSLSNPNFRHLAIELAQEANDWKALCDLAELELKEAKDRADAWLFRAIVHFNQRELEPLKVLLGGAPIDLKGSPRTIAGLANLEIRFGNASKGMNRLYRKLRQNLDDADAASAFFAISTTAPQDLFAESLEQVADGTTVSLKVEGQERKLTIDPSAAGSLPARPDFVASTDAVAKELLGKRVGDRIAITESFGFSREYEITGVQSAYLSAARRAGEFILTSVKPVKGFLSVPIPTGENGRPDFRHVLDQLKRNTERVSGGFEAYGEGKITLGVLATALGTNTAILSNDWPAKPAPMLYVCSGNPPEREAAQRRFTERSKNAVIDLLTLMEFVTCDCEAAFSLVAPVFIPQSAVDSIQTMIDEAENDPSSSSLREENGQFVITEHTDEWKQRRLKALQKIKLCIDKYCKPTPAYGPENVPEDVRKLGAVLDKESFDAMLLALENDALLVTLDGRLREYAAHFGKIGGVWPQIVFAEALARGVISQPTYSQAVVRQLATRRTHTSLGPGDILWLLQQSDSLLQAGIRSVKEHLSDPRVEAISAFRVVAELIGHLLRGSAQLGAIGEITEHLLGAVFSHPSLDRIEAPKIAETLIIRVLDAQFEHDGSDSINQRHYAWREYLLGAVRRAGELAKLPSEQLLQRTPRVRNLFCYRRPLLLYTGVEGSKEVPGS